MASCIPLSNISKLRCPLLGRQERRGGLVDETLRISNSFGLRSVHWQLSASKAATPYLRHVYEHRSRQRVPPPRSTSDKDINSVSSNSYPTFGSEDELKTFLEGLSKSLGQYACTLWAGGRGITDAKLLAWLESTYLIELGVAPMHAVALQRAVAQYAPGKPRQSEVFSPLMGSGAEGWLGARFPTWREKTVLGIWDKVNRRGYTIIKGPPRSGKTALLQLVGNFAQKQGAQFYYVTLGHTLDVMQAIKQQTGSSLEELVSSETEVLLAVDEMQRAYAVEASNSERLWALLKALEGGLLSPKPRIRVLLAAAYGGRPSGLKYSGADVIPPTPIETTNSDTVVTLQNDTAGPSLILEESEVDEMFESFESVTGLQFEPVLKEIIINLSGRQVGGLVHILTYLDDRLVNEARAGPAVNRAALYKLGSSKFVNSIGLLRSVSDYSTLLEIPSAVNLLRRLLYCEALSITELTEEKADACKILAITGQVYVNDTNNDTTMDPQVLLFAESRTADGKLLERIYQMEAYRTGSTLMPRGGILSVDVGRTLGAHSAAYCDMFAGEPYGYLIELLRDAEALEEHLERFSPEGKYYPMLSKGSAREYAVVDLRYPSAGQGW